MLDKIKSYWTYILEGLVAILTLAFFIERNKASSSEALVDNQKDIAKVDKDNAQIQSNETELKQEEEKREEIKKEGEDAKSSDDSTNILKQR